MNDRALCSRCGGNGTVKIPGGVSVCPQCDGECWQPTAQEYVRCGKGVRSPEGEYNCLREKGHSGSCGIQRPAPVVAEVRRAPIDLQTYIARWDVKHPPSSEAQSDVIALIDECTKRGLRLDKLQDQVARLTAERDEARKQARDNQPCVICGWPRPMDNDYNICECCGFEPRVDEPEHYRWKGEWWAKDLEPIPKIVQAFQALRTRLLGLEQQWREGAKQADRWAAEHDAKHDGANSHAFRKERRIWTTCADELARLLTTPEEPRT